MKTLTWMFLAACSSLLLLPACNSEQAIRLDPTPMPRQARQFVRLKIEMPNALEVRSQTTDPMKVVQSLRLLFYNAQSSKLEHVREVAPTALSDLVLSLPKDDYKLVVMGNPTPELKALTMPGASLDQLSKPQNIKGSAFYIEDLSTQTVKSIALLNEQGAVHVPSSAFSLQAKDAQPRPAIRLEAALARVLVYGTPKLVGGRAGQASAKFLINSLARRVAPLRPLGLLSSGEPEQVGDGSATKDRYASGELFSAWSPSVSLSTLIAHHTKSTASHAGNWAEVKPSLDQAQGTIALANYAKESVLPPAAFVEGAVPCVVLSYPFIPETLTLEQGEGWVSYQGHYYGERALKAMISSGNYSGDEALRTAVQQAGLSETSFSEAFEREGIRFYKNALSYYLVYIRHFSDEQAPLIHSAGRYGVVRNNEYRLRLSSISAPGSPVFPDLSERRTSLADLHKLKPVVEVLDPTIREQEIDL